jgi:hypothetical protein
MVGFIFEIQRVVELKDAVVPVQTQRDTERHRETQGWTPSRIDTWTPSRIGDWQIRIGVNRQNFEHRSGWHSH